jgi:hypothetical protein
VRRPNWPKGHARAESNRFGKDVSARLASKNGQRRLHYRMQ